MTAPSPVVDLDDVASVEAADATGALRAAALGGAQVRAVSAELAEAVGDRLAGLRPRSVVLVPGAGRPARAAAVLAAALGGQVSLPLVVAPETPPWVGPLDVVLVGGDDAADRRLAEAIDRGVRRRADVIVVAPDEGPLQAAAAGRAIMLPPRVPVPDQDTLSRHLAAGIGVLAALADDRNRGLLPEPDRLADALDAEALRNHPSNEVFHNPAKSLAARMQNRRIVVTGDGVATAELARHVVEVLARGAGRVATAVDLMDALAGAAALTAADHPPGFDPLFHDEELDGPAPGEPARLFVLSTTDDPLAVHRRIAAFGDADVVTAVADDPIAGAPGSVAGPDAPLIRLATLAVRCETAAVYLRLVEGKGQDGRKGDR